jgi:glycolate oxidase
MGIVIEAGLSVRDELAAALGPAVSFDPRQLELLRTDRSGQVSAAPPFALVSARTIEDVQATMRIATSHRVPVVPRGAGTGLAGGSIGTEGEIVISTLAMTRILEVNVDDELAVVEPGILNDDLNAALAPRGLWFAPDPASKAISTVGGNIATNAGGLLCAKYGVTREAILGLRIVLADGRLMTHGQRTV